MKVRIIDCETTGTEDDAKVVELAFIELPDGFPWEQSTVFQTLIDPGCEIPPTAKAVHHITEDMVAGAPGLDAVIAEWRDEDYVYVAHNARFDQRFLGGLGSRWVCTYKCALRHWPEAPGHSNQVLSYWLKNPRPPESAGHAHRALYDAWTTLRIYEALRAYGWSIERMLEVSAQPALLPRFRFGKHANVPLAEVPTDYLQWMARQDFDEDVLHTAKTEIERRAA